jgi:hypothetical protein
MRSRKPVMTSRKSSDDRTPSRNRITFQLWPFVEGSAEGVWGILALLALGASSLVLYYLCYVH